MLDDAEFAWAAQAFVAQWISSFRDFPPRQKPASFSIDEIMKKLEDPHGK